MNPLVDGFCLGVRASDRRPPWQWCEDHVVVDNTSPMPGRWRSDMSPWVRDVMEVFGDNHVSDISVRCSAQSAKTQTLMCCACWLISEDPGPAMWVMAARDESRQFVRDRITPSFENCKPVKEQMLTAEILEFTFASMPFYFVGAGSPSKLQSKPIRWLILDEVRNYPPGALETVLKRTRAFWNSRRVIVSTPGLEDDAVDRAYKEGDQRVYHIACPKCSHLQPLKWEQLKWDTNDTTKPNGRWNYDNLASTIRFECAECKHEIRDTPTERKGIARNGKFVRMNPTAPKHRVSFHWNALLPPWVEWRSLVEEFLTARNAAKKGHMEPMKTFVNESLGEPWKDQLGEIEDFDFLLARRGDWQFGDPWPERHCRFMAADRQAAGGEHYWYVIREYGDNGKSRLVSYGRCNTTAELEEIRKAHDVPAVNCAIDSGFKASEVYKFCLQSGWRPFKGDDAEFFTLQDVNMKKVVKKLWQLTTVDPAFGTRLQGKVRTLKLHRWSNPSIKDRLLSYLTGFVPGWEIPSEIGRDYLKQMSAEHRVEEVDARGRVKFRWHQKHKDNHLFDCELMILVMGLMSGKAVSKG
jgi:phage terminase large subunit GpA-like protein